MHCFVNIPRDWPPSHVIFYLNNYAHLEYLTFSIIIYNSLTDTAYGVQKVKHQHTHGTIEGILLLLIVPYIGIFIP